MRILAGLFLLGTTCAVQAQSLEPALLDSAKATTKQFQGLRPDQFAITVIDLNHGTTASYRGDAAIYPASVVKLFYLVAAHERMQAGALADTPELRRAIHDMIVDSSNDATGVVLDAITGTTGGPELPAPEFEAWVKKRNAVNQYFSSLGYIGINVNQKTFAEGPYGRERQSRGPHFENNNRLTTDATARLLRSIVQGEAVSKSRSGEMMELLHRDLLVASKDPDSQALGFSGKSLPKGTQYYAKAGWTSTTRHDATYVELPNGARYIAVIFTIDHANESEIIRFVAKRLVDYFLAAKP
jgi:beta-lactamase class A